MKRENEPNQPAPGTDPEFDRSIAEDASQTKAEAVVSESTGQDPESTYFDFLMHERVQKMHTAGLFTDLGERWGGLFVRLRGTHVKAVVVRREQAEQNVRMKLGLDDSDPIPPSESIEINKATMTMAITGALGQINSSPAQLSIAEQSGWTIDRLPETDERPALNLVRFSGSEELEQAENVRLFFAPILEGSMPFLTTLIRASRQLQKVRDDVIDREGKDFVFGRHVKLDWRD